MDKQMYRNKILADINELEKECNMNTDVSKLSIKGLVRRIRYYFFRVFIKPYYDNAINKQKILNEKMIEIHKNVWNELNNNENDNAEFYNHINASLKDSFDKLNNDLKENIKKEFTDYSNTTKDTLDIYRKRLEDDERTIIEISKSAERIDGDENTIVKLSEKMDVLERYSETLRNNIENLECKVNQIYESGFDINHTHEFNIFNKNTTSQAGEDCILAYVAAVLGIPFHECTYLDLGANHPKVMNNTFLFYQQGAKGVLVEANPKLIPELKFYRHRDLILNRCVDVKSGDFIEFNVMNYDGLSTPDASSADNLTLNYEDIKIVEKVAVETISVNDIIDIYMGECPLILSIDIEGNDMKILSSIDFTKYRPLLIIVEMIEYSKKLTVGMKNNEILEFMEMNNYIEYAFTGINSIFIDKTKI